MTDKLTRSAQGQECQIRIPEICSHDNETVVFCHLPGGGMGKKVDSIFGSYGCDRCHQEVDRRTRLIDSQMATIYFFDGVIRTQKIMLAEGLITHA